MRKGQQLLIVEPRYDYVNFEMSFLINALRLALPNHFPNNKDYKNIYDQSYDIYRELGELDQEQSSHDNESPSGFIVDTVNKYFENVELKYSTTFFDKFIGSARLEEDDNKKLSHILKALDELILKYNNNFARNVMISATKT